MHALADAQLASQLRTRFVALWRRCLLPAARSDAEAVWQVIDRAYTQAHRFYHDRVHLAHCIEQVDLAAGHIGHVDRVELALWFHDIVLEPGRTDDEARSAALFRELADGAMAADFVAAVADLILATTHRVPPSSPCAQYVCDIDLASFGCPWERYLADTLNVKAEFEGSAEEYYVRKRAFLEAMLRRPKIFHSDFFHALYERQARANIRRLLDMMARGEV